VVPVSARGAARRLHSAVFLGTDGTVYFRPDAAMPQDDELHIRLGRIRNRGGGRRARGFVGRVLAAAEKSGYGFGQPRAPSARARRSGFGRGRAATWAAERLLSERTRRVIVKARVVRHGARQVPLAAHLGYLKRDGVTRDGERARMFSAEADGVDERDFARRCAADRHHFRFTVSPEDAAEMGDLRGFTRDLMREIEQDLRTRLDWVAVDHWNTDNPHVHIVLRGRTEAGHDLVISRDYISLGMRARAAELVTLELGPRSEVEIRRKLAREIEPERWTRLDAALRRQAMASPDGVIDFRPEAGDLADQDLRNVMIGRLQRLERMGLAQAAGPAQWRLREDAEPVLRELGIRGDIVKTMHRAMTKAGEVRSPADYAIHDTPATVLGKLVEKGHDEASERPYLLVDGVDGRLHYVRLSMLADLDDLPIGGILAVQPVSLRRSDSAIFELAKANAGIYAPEHHLEQLRTSGAADPDAVVEAHVRRLEAMRRRGGHADRLPDGHWQIPGDYLERVQANTATHGQDVEVRVLSDLPLQQQVTAPGATWLDGELVGRKRLEPARRGFGQAVRDALERRSEHLASEGLARRQANRFVFAQDLLDRLTRRELARTASAIANESGLRHQPLGDGDRISGIYRRRLALASGRFALIDDGKQFVLVPWREVMERRLGRSVSGVLRSGGVSWSFGRERGPSIG
jgi:type IV secretory pathway VirD2 relaxase